MRVQSKPRLGWMDSVKMALGSRGMTMEAARWSALVAMLMIEFLMRSFLRGSAFFRTALPRSAGLSPGEE